MWPGVYSHHRPGDGIEGTVSASGVASGYLGPCPEGWQWYVERMTCWSNTVAAAGLLEVFVLSTNKIPLANDKRGRQDVATGTVVQEGISDEKSPIVVPAGYFLVASWSGLTANDLVSLSFQIRLHDLHPGHRQHQHHHHQLLANEE